MAKRCIGGKNQDCPRRARAHNMCAAHYQAHLKGKPIDYDLQPRGEDRLSKPCEVPDCRLTAFQKGLCASHYQASRNGKDLNYTVQARKKRWAHGGCFVDGCTNPHQASGYCSTHYNHYVRGKLELKDIIPTNTCSDPDCRATWQEVQLLKEALERTSHLSQEAVDNGDYMKARALSSSIIDGQHRVEDMRDHLRAEHQLEIEAYRQRGDFSI